MSTAVFQSSPLGSEDMIVTYLDRLSLDSFGVFGAELDQLVRPGRPPIEYFRLPKSVI